MIVKPETRAALSDAQFETLTKVARRLGSAAVRFADTKTVRTLIALDKRGHATLRWGVVDGRRGITSAAITIRGEKTLASETARRAAVAEYDRIMKAIAPVRTEAAQPTLAIRTDDTGRVADIVGTPSLVARVDPFEVVRTGQPKQLALPF